MIPTPDEVAELRAGRLPPRCRDRANVLLSRLFAARAPSAEPTPAAPALEADLRDGAVVAIDCVVEWERAGPLCVYRARSAPQVVLHPTVYQPRLPGRWRLFVLRGSGLVVGGEAWGASPTAPSAGSEAHVAAYRHALLAAQGHTPADLVALAQGHLPPSAARWARAGRATRAVLAGLAFVAAAAAGVAAVGLHLPILWLGSAAAAAVALGLTARLLLAEARPSSLRGTAVAAPTSGGPGAAWWVDVDGVVFRSQSGHPLAGVVGPLLVPGLRVVAFQAQGTLVAIDLEPDTLG